jgi:hypothetical protein
MVIDAPHGPNRRLKLKGSPSMFTALSVYLTAWLAKNGVSIALKAAPFAVLFVTLVIVYFSNSAVGRVASAVACVSEFVVMLSLSNMLPSLSLPAVPPAPKA